MLIGSASTQTRIMIPESSFEETADLPVTISGITAATGISFELFYDRDIICIEDIIASSEIPGSDVEARIDNDIGYAKVAIPNTEGISAVESTPLAIIQLTRVGPGGSTVIIQDPRWSDTQFVTNTFDVILNGSIVSLDVVAPAATATSSSGSRSSSSSSSGAPASTPAPGGTVTPAVATTAPGTAMPVSPGDTTQTPPAAPPGTTAGSTQPPVTTVASPGFCTGVVLVSGLIGAALLLYRRS